MNNPKFDEKKMAILKGLHDELVDVFMNTMKKFLDDDSIDYRAVMGAGMTASAFLNDRLNGVDIFKHVEEMIKQDPHLESRIKMNEELK